MHENTSKRKLTRNPLGDGSAHINLFVKGIYQREKRFACIHRATQCIQSFTQTLWNRDVEIIKFPSGYLSKSVSDFDTNTIRGLANETAKSGWSS